MKVIRMAPNLNFGGIESRLVNISKDKTEIFEQIFVAIGKGGQALDDIKSNNKLVHNLNLKTKIPSIFTIMKIYIFLKKNRPDVVHTSGAEANFHGIIASKLANVPKIVGEEVGIPNQSGIAKFVFSIVYKFADCIIGNSTPVIEFLRTENKVDPKKLFKVSNPMVINNIPKLKKKGVPFIFITVSRIEPIKNINGIISAFTRLDNTLNCELWIVGDGSELEKLKNQVNETGFSNKVKFLGYEKNPINVLAQADCFILNSFSEGFSNSLVEAMFAKLVCISTKVGAACEIIKDGKTGFLIEPDNITDLHKKMEEVKKLSIFERNKIGNLACEFVISEFNLKNHLLILKEIYQFQE